MKCYLLDTNTISHIVKNQQKVIKRLVSIPMSAIYISSITYAEIQYGLAKRPGAKTLKNTINELLKRIDVLSWDHSTAEVYGKLRASLEQQGKSIDTLDLLIASHAVSNNMTLVSDDLAFKYLKTLKLENWLRM
jgi:tRNA(fMet)-specific endonuclease VapC